VALRTHFVAPVSTAGPPVCQCAANLAGHLPMRVSASPEPRSCPRARSRLMTRSSMARRGHDAAARCWQVLRRWVRRTSNVHQQRCLGPVLRCCNWSTARELSVWIYPSTDGVRLIFGCVERSAGGKETPSFQSDWFKYILCPYQIACSFGAAWCYQRLRAPPRPLHCPWPPVCRRCSARAGAKWLEL
jgi:hypothetical protein